MAPLRAPTYISHLGEGMSTFMEATAGTGDADEQRRVAIARFDAAMREERARIIDAMGRDHRSGVEA